ncbi:MAG: acyltransferase [Flavobacteriia bacterium]|nr:acyltransferase [Flavobacteriia bacterium]MBH2023630.1 acyltransferase [Flavobacteriales bacterium]
MNSSSKVFMPALTGFRAIAAGMIFVLHFFPFSNPAFPDFIKNFIREWHIGVDMFFVLSGFLITYRYFDQHQLNFRKYIVNRFSRIYPMYFIITAGVFVDFYIRNQLWNTEKTVEAILSFTMTKALFTEYFFTAGISQGWTLTLEELFYITAPFYFILIKRNRLWLYLLPLIIFIFGLLLKNTANVAANSWGFMQTNIAVYIFEFFAGIALALLLKKHKKLMLPNGFATYFGIGFILLYLIMNPWAHGSHDLLRATQVLVLSVLGIAPLLWGLIHERTLVSRFLSTDTMTLLGKSSYVFYLIHKGFIPILIYDYIAENVAVIFVIITALSVLMFKYIEEPLNHFIRKRYAK